jgi:glycosyltransferase involved in cell wall biosynthesis
VLFVGNISPRKGIDTLLDGLAATAADATLTVVGRSVDDAYSSRLRGRVADHGLTDRVTFTGELSDTELAERFHDHHALAVPSRYEGFGQTVSESLACGTPVVAFDATGPSDIVDHKETGWLAEPYKVEELAEGIRWVVEESDKKRLTEDAKNQAAAKYDQEMIARRYANLYKNQY